MAWLRTIAVFSRIKDNGRQTDRAAALARESLDKFFHLLGPVAMEVPIDIAISETPVGDYLKKISAQLEQYLGE